MPKEDVTAARMLDPIFVDEPFDPLAKKQAPQSPQAPAVQFAAMEPPVANRGKLTENRQGTVPVGDVILSPHPQVALAPELDVVQATAEPIKPQHPQISDGANLADTVYSAIIGTLGNVPMLSPSGTNALTAAPPIDQEASPVLHDPSMPHCDQISEVQHLDSNSQVAIFAADEAFNPPTLESHVTDSNSEKKASQAANVRLMVNQPPMANRGSTDENAQGETSPDEEIMDLSTIGSLLVGAVAGNTTLKDLNIGLTHENNADKNQDGNRSGAILADQGMVDLNPASSLIPTESIKKYEPQSCSREVNRNPPVGDGGGNRDESLPLIPSNAELNPENLVGIGKRHLYKGNILADEQTDDDMIDLVIGSSLTANATVEKEAPQHPSAEVNRNKLADGDGVRFDNETMNLTTPKSLMQPPAEAALSRVNLIGSTKSRLHESIILADEQTDEDMIDFVSGSTLIANAAVKKEAPLGSNVQSKGLVTGSTLPPNVIVKKEALQPFKAEPMPHPAMASHHNIAGISNLAGIFNNPKMFDLLISGPSGNATAQQAVLQQPNPPSNSDILLHTPSRKDEILGDDEIGNLFTLNTLTADATAEEETPPQLNVKLMPHQRRAIKWMANRENLPENDSRHSCEGGILADDQGLGKTLTMLALLFHNTEEGGPWRTLIVCPLSLVSQWKREIETRVNEHHKKSVYVYHGPKRTKTSYDLKEYDFVITTYQTLAHEYPKVLKDHPSYAFAKEHELDLPTRKKGAAFRLKWNRIVLDEAHAINNRGTERWKAVDALDAGFRWCLTGTPIQNSVNDIFSLLIFIKYQFVANVEEWNQKWKNRLESKYPKVRERAFKRFQAILGPVLLRRTKNDKINGKPLIILPKRDVVVLEETLEEEETALYKALETKAIITFNKFLMAGTVTSNYTNILTLLLRLRQAVCHPFLIQYCDMRKGEETPAKKTIRDIVQMDEEEESEDEVPYSDDVNFIDDRSEAEIWDDVESKKSDDEMDIEEEISARTRRARKRSRGIRASDSDDEDLESESALKVPKSDDGDGENGNAVKRSGARGDGSEDGNPRKRAKSMKTSDIERNDEVGNTIAVPNVVVAKVEYEIVDLTVDDDVDTLQKNPVAKQEVQMLGITRSGQHGVGAENSTTVVVEFTGDDDNDSSDDPPVIPKNGVVKQMGVHTEDKIMEPTTSTQHNGVVKMEGEVTNLPIVAGGVQSVMGLQEKAVVKQETVKMEDALLPAFANPQQNGAVKVENGAVDLTDDNVLFGNSEVLADFVKQEDKKPKRGKKEMARDMREVVMRPSRKITVLLTKLKETRDEEPYRKSLVFSQWTSCMDIISCHLEKEGIGYCRLDGSMSIAKRNKEIKLFQTDVKKKVFLISLMAGGTGLNLTCASQVFLFDVWWNPAVEEQAIDRVHRIGQLRDVRVFRFRIMGTIEDRIYKVCQFKKETSDGALGIAGKQTPGRTKLTLDELKILFTAD